MAGKVTTAPLDEGEPGEAADARAVGGSFFGRLIVRITGMGRMKLMTCGSLLLLVAAGAYGAMTYTDGTERGPAVETVETYHHELPEIMVNLSAGNDRPQYLRLKITLELDNPQAVEALKPVLPRVVDAFQVHLRELRASDLEGSAGLFRLREELTRRVNHAIAPASIRAVLFREVVVQ